MILENQLLTSSVCPTAETKRLFRETACRLEPFGCVSARACNFESDRYYIVLDTGTGDFFGNMASLLVALYEQEMEHDHFGLDTQAMVSKFWGLALIYYDYGFTTNNEALVFPHFKYAKLNPKAQPYARLLSSAAQQFFLYHEFGHVVDGFSDSPLGTEDAEYSADMFAFTAVRETAFSINDTNIITWTILGCVLALLAIEFVESTFPGLTIVRGGTETIFPGPSASYPTARSRFHRLLDCFPEKQRRMLETNPVFKLMRKVCSGYSQQIREGARPSKAHWDLMESVLESHQRRKADRG